MNMKNEILGFLQKVKPGAEIPSSYDYSYDAAEKSLTLKLRVEGLKANMQDNEAAFESWAIALKFYLKDKVNTVIIDWERDLAKGEDGYYHFNRFVYRLAKFVQTYSWARSAKTIPCIPSLLYCNAPSQKADGINNKKADSETGLEGRYVLAHSKDYKAINQQLPVGLFERKISRDTHYTTGGKSAIDIWAITKEGHCLSIFELKKSDNNPLGIISELMFYTNVLDDIMSHRIMYEENGKTQNAIQNNTRGFKSLYEAYSTGSINSIEAIFLADELHMLLSEDLIEFINASARFKYKKISFKHKKCHE